jgi:hypothetical protein
MNAIHKMNRGAPVPERKNNPSPVKVVPHALAFEERESH